MSKTDQRVKLNEIQETSIMALVQWRDRTMAEADATLARIGSAIDALTKEYAEKLAMPEGSIVKGSPGKLFLVFEETEELEGTDEVGNDG